MDLKESLAQLLPVVVGGVAMFLLQKFGLVKPPVKPDPANPSAPASPSTPLDGLLAPLDYMLRNPILAGIVRPLVEDFIRKLQETILPKQEFLEKK